MLTVAFDKIVPLTEARARLSEIVEKAVGEHIWIIAKGGKPKLAVVDVNYLNDLLRKARFDALTERSRAAFDAYLRKQGLNPDTISEEEAEAILQR